MFATAIAKARQFTRPVVISRRSATGECSSTVGAYVAVNADGWILTAAHILRYCQQLSVSQAAFQKRQADEQRIRSSIKGDQLGDALGELPTIDDSMTDRYSVWWGADD